VRPCLICAHEQLEPSQKNGGGCDCVQIISLAELQDKECMTKLSNLLLDIDLFVYIMFFYCFIMARIVHTKFLRCVQLIAYITTN
jgi:hypothetical protein